MTTVPKGVLIAGKAEIRKEEHLKPVIRVSPHRKPENSGQKHPKGSIVKKPKEEQRSGK